MSPDLTSDTHTHTNHTETTKRPERNHTDSRSAPSLLSCIHPPPWVALPGLVKLLIVAFRRCCIMQRGANRANIGARRRSSGSRCFDRRLPSPSSAVRGRLNFPNRGPCVAPPSSSLFDSPGFKVLRVSGPVYTKTFF